MKIGITLGEGHGLGSEVCARFGQCTHFLLVDVENGQIKGFATVPNTTVHGGAGCQAVEEILRYKVTHMIAGGMGMNAQNKFFAANVPVFGYCGRAEDAVQALLANELGGIEPCAVEENLKN